MSAGTLERGGGRSALAGEIGVVTMNCELGEGGTEPAFESASVACGTVSPVPRTPAPSAAFASSARSSSVARSMAETGEVGTGMGGGGGGREGTRYERRLTGKVGSSWALGPRALLSWMEMRGREGLVAWLGLRGGGSTESGRARVSLEESTGNAGGRGDARVTNSEISCAIHATSSETSSSRKEVIEAFRTGSASSGMGCTKSTEARWDLYVGARMRLNSFLGDSSSSEVGGVEQGVLGLQVDASELVTEGEGDCSRFLDNDGMRVADVGGEGKSSEIPRPEKRRLISSSGDSAAGDDVTDRGGGVIGRRGGDGVRALGALAGGKKSSKVIPSTPVKTTLREWRLSCVGRTPSVALAATYGEW